MPKSIYVDGQYCGKETLDWKPYDDTKKNNPDMDYHFGFADINHKFKDELILMMEEYTIKKYIIALEKVEGNKTHIATQGEHIHFVIYTEPKIFKRFKETLKNKYLLSGKNGKTGRYAGWINKDKVKSEHKFMAYTCKDNNLVWEGFTDDEIKKLLDDSFQKNDTLIDELMKWLKAYRPELRTTQDTGTYLNKFKEPVYQDKYDLQKVEMEVLKFYMNKEKKICKSQIKNLTLTYLQLYMEDRFNAVDTIYHYCMNN